MHGHGLFKVTGVLGKPAAFNFVARRRGKGKGILVQTWTDPEGSRILRLPDFNRHMKAVSLSALRTGRLYPPENIPGTHFC